MAIRFAIALRPKSLIWPSSWTPNRSTSESSGDIGASSNGAFGVDLVELRIPEIIGRMSDALIGSGSRTFESPSFEIYPRLLSSESN
jgi:hypothetical protein